MEYGFTSSDCKKIGGRFEVGRRNKKADLYAPCNKSLFLIMQFAAAYHVEKSLSLRSLSEIILN